MKRGKKYQKVTEKILDSAVSLKNAVENVKKLSYSKFDGTIELHIVTILPKDKDPKSIKGSVSLPYMESKSSRIAVAAPAHLEKTAQEAGADIFKFDDLMEGIKAGKIDFDILLATPDMMAQLAVHGKALGPKGLMPNPKNGTVVAPDKLAEVVGEFKRGKLVYKADAAGGIHVAVGKISYTNEKIEANVKEMVTAVVSLLGKSKEYVIRKAFLAPTMGPSVAFDIKLMD
ncbi:50S ribosomal protein L1 [Candidatus Dojkabacteria bacterium CG_4_9_14_3_um_filter_150_Dojkabacteria_WS6_41_13]|uniref:Large ribosomal subunit protein uL1 n=1 Tax=Candidatus Dojkabacteria bacterium CG_4_10_14_0_2_um_filter_Dojkabacteria_WS6_41_15 TaxID=2014249 RepID=A0A2M7W1N1_9BACT|nr:MAG: 50S ribosomal protein L1 [Candidatus Dojkabacteria bacterium CG_4_10_14_3_um_filter_Dojkabacteria_WS6_41_9]PJA13666.1 MAG: 50S ribosomal protein L1 [Candidatus Dojkabacteria bacterium CG_4_10_14_0_2_um_filter_Dojkabacteria_WS6_41_15]PJB23120.1 MAG: 50S ribosomal protein L1 [Candidatus Dojkabacteria bacterium CG_4_9_14_3_um_filter_150_Dojkabacteria_WS6_41_13]